MYPMLILREELVCMVLLLILLISSEGYRKGKDGKRFNRMLLAAMVHVAFDGITVWTVNHPDTVPGPVNDLMHALFYLSAVFFTRKMLIYTVALMYPEKEKTCRIVSWAVMGLLAAAMAFIPMEYGAFEGTRAGAGTNAMLTFASAGGFILLSLGMILFNRYKLSGRVRRVLTAMLMILLAVAALQLWNRAILLTGGMVTVVTAGFFFTLENPAIAMEREAHTDAMTGVENRNAYERDIQEYDRMYQKDPSLRFIFLFTDLNNLKSVNGMFGHRAGDEYITFVATILRQHLSEAEHVYRMGGDEFLAVFLNVPEETVTAAVEKIHKACVAEAGKRDYTPMLATGYAISGPQYKSLHDVLRVADYMMYQNKAELKREISSSSIGRRGTTLNLTGLMDRVFDAMCLADDHFYPYMTNLETGVTRIAPGLAERFGLESEFYENFLETISAYVHPEDVDRLQEDVMGVLKEHDRHHNCALRIRDRAGVYVHVISRGGVYHGKDGEPDLFCGYFIQYPEE